MSDDCESVKEDVQLLQDAVLYATEKRYRDVSEKNWKRSMWRKVDRFKILSGELLYIKKDKKEVNIKYFPTHLYYQIIMYRLDMLQMQKSKSRFWKDVIKIQLLVTWVQKEL